METNIKQHMREEVDTTMPDSSTQEEYEAEISRQDKVLLSSIKNSNPSTEEALIEDRALGITISLRSKVCCSSMLLGYCLDARANILSNRQSKLNSTYIS